MKFIRISYALLIQLVLLCLYSCSVTNSSYKRPDLGIPQSHRSNNPSTDTTTVANWNWKKIFTDKFLNNHIEKALENNLDMKKAIQNISIANSYVKQSKAEFFPTLNLSTGAGALKPSLNSLQGQALTSPKTFEQYLVQANTSWEIDIWGKISSAKKAALASYLQTISAQQAVKANLIANVASNYYLLLSLDKQKNILDSTIINREKSVETLKALKSAGSVSEVAVKQNEAILYFAQAMKVDVENQQKIIENTLCILLGQEPSSILRSTIDEQKLPEEILTGIPIQLLSNRPDVLAAENSLINAFELNNVAKSSLYPSLKIDASFALNSMSFTDLFSVNSIFMNLLGSLTQPIFNNRALKTQVEVSQSKKEIAFLNYKQTILNAYKEVSDAIYTYETQTKKLNIQEKENKSLKLATDYSEELLNQGMVNYLEVLRAKDNLLNNQIDLTKTQFNKLKSTVDLYRALGGGWKE